MIRASNQRPTKRLLDRPGQKDLVCELRPHLVSFRPKRSPCDGPLTVTETPERLYQMLLRLKIEREKAERAELRGERRKGKGRRKR